MADTTSFALLGTFSGFGKGDKGPAYGTIKGQDGTDTKVKVWPTVKDFREKPPVENTNPAIGPAEEGAFGLWTGYSKVESWPDKESGEEVFKRAWYVTGYESQEPPQENSWGAEDEQPIDMVPAMVVQPNASTASLPVESKDALIHAAMELLEKALAG